MLLCSQELFQQYTKKQKKHGFFIMTIHLPIMKNCCIQNEISQTKGSPLPTIRPRHPPEVNVWSLLKRRISSNHGQTKALLINCSKIAWTSFKKEVVQLFPHSMHLRLQTWLPMLAFLPISEQFSCFVYFLLSLFTSFFPQKNAFLQNLKILLNLWHLSVFKFSDFGGFGEWAVNLIQDIHTVNYSLQPCIIFHHHDTQQFVWTTPDLSWFWLYFFEANLWQECWLEFVWTQNICSSTHESSEFLLFFKLISAYFWQPSKQNW